MDYLSNMYTVLETMNRAAFEYRDGKAWDNKKDKTFKRQTPRGKTYMRLTQMERSAHWERFKLETKMLIDDIAATQPTTTSIPVVKI